MNIAEYKLKQGADFPYDAPDAWRYNDGKNAIPAKDWAHAAARGILADLNDRAGIKQQLRGIDEDVRAEIVESLAEIIRVASADRLT